MTSILRVLGTVAGVLFLAGAWRAARRGTLASPEKMVYGHPVGRVWIRRGERPLAFWSCVAAYAVCGAGALAVVWLVI